MTIVISELYEAFISAGCPPEKAKAASNIKNFRACGIQKDFQGVRDEFSKIKTDLIILKWMAGVVVVATVIPFLKTIFGF